MHEREHRVNEDKREEIASAFLSVLLRFRRYCLFSMCTHHVIGGRMYKWWWGEWWWKWNNKHIYQTRLPACSQTMSQEESLCDFFLDIYTNSIVQLINNKEEKTISAELTGRQIEYRREKRSISYARYNRHTHFLLPISRFLISPFESNYLRHT